MTDSTEFNAGERASAIARQVSKPDQYFVGDRSEFLDWVGGRYPRVLEIGCGAGGNAAWYRQSGAEFVTGIEIQKDVAALAGERFDQVIVGPVETALDELTGPFDLIVCCDVLEHLVDPWEVVARFRHLSHPETVLAVSIPNIRYYRAVARIAVGRGFQYEPSGIFDSTHLRFFTQPDVNRLLVRGGWTAQKWGCPPPGWKGRALRRVSGDRLLQWVAGQLYVCAVPSRA